MATHSGILAWEIPWIEKLGSLYNFYPLEMSLGLVSKGKTDTDFTE